MRFSLKWLLIVIAIICAGLTLIRSGLSWVSPFDDLAFSPAAWREAASDETRARMAHDLISSHLPHGTSEAQVIARLGEPDWTLSGEVDDGGNSLPGEQTYVYMIGNWSSYGMDDAYVYVHFDSIGQVISAEINGY